VNWEDLDVLSDAGVNWSDIDVLSDTGINWTDIDVMSDMHSEQQVRNILGLKTNVDIRYV